LEAYATAIFKAFETDEKKLTPETATEVANATLEKVTSFVSELTNNHMFS
jgi:hypothetical protein